MKLPGKYVGIYYATGLAVGDGIGVEPPLTAELRSILLWWMKFRATHWPSIGISAGSIIVSLLCVWLERWQDVATNMLTALLFAWLIARDITLWKIDMAILNFIFRWQHVLPWVDGS